QIRPHSPHQSPEYNSQYCLQAEQAAPCKGSHHRPAGYYWCDRLRCRAVQWFRLPQHSQRWLSGVAPMAYPEVCKAAPRMWGSNYQSTVVRTATRYYEWLFPSLQADWSETGWAYAQNSFCLW